jgi:AraC-like DNA-binding protein
VRSRLHSGEGEAAAANAAIPQAVPRCFQRRDVRAAPAWADWRLPSLARDAGYKVGSLATLLLLERKQLNRLFLKIFSIPPEIWVTELRIWDSARLLCTGNTLKESAFQCGFSDCGNFCHWFKSHHKMTPSEFLDRHRQWVSNQEAQMLAQTDDPETLTIRQPWEVVEWNLCFGLRLRQIE